MKKYNLIIKSNYYYLYFFTLFLSNFSYSFFSMRSSTIYSSFFNQNGKIKTLTPINKISSAKISNKNNSNLKNIVSHKEHEYYLEEYVEKNEDILLKILSKKIIKEYKNHDDHDGKEISVERLKPNEISNTYKALYFIVDKEYKNRDGKEIPVNCLKFAHATITVRARNEKLNKRTTESEIINFVRNSNNTDCYSLLNVQQHLYNQEFNILIDKLEIIEEILKELEKEKDLEKE